MVDFTGHLAFGLLFVVPVWFIWRRKVAVVFVALAVGASLLPDGDVWLSGIWPQYFHHHGVTHTILFVVIASLLVGALAAVVLTGPIDDWLGWERFDRWSLFAFAFSAFFLGGLSHVFADLLSAPDISTPIEPFWPFFDKPFSVNVLYYDDPTWNGVFLVVMVLVHVGLAVAVGPLDHRYRFRGRAN